MPLHLEQEAAIKAIPGVAALEPSVVRAGIVKNGEIIHGVIVKGISDAPSSSGSTSSFSGSSREPLPVSIPHRLAEITGLGPGDKLTTYFIGEKVRVRQFNIIGIHRDILEADDNLLVYARLEDMQRLCGWTEDQVSCIDVRLKESHRGKRAQEDIASRIGFMLMDESLYVSSSAHTYPQIFDWLSLLDFNVAVILILMTLVAGFNMVSGLLIMLLRNISTIGTLKTMGMGDDSIGKVFVRSGAVAVLKGMLWGNALALLFCLIQGTTHLIPLDPENYFVSFVPVHVSVPGIILADIAAFAGILALLWLPARLISRIDPSKTVKAD
ncbi:MAG: ABC transporter permease, partial [Bacteroidales bacterium]|nr:ABC transporter permease [Bacteroidales bacterium]